MEIPKGAARCADFLCASQEKKEKLRDLLMFNSMSPSSERGYRCADKKTQSLTGCESVMCEVSVKVQQNRSILTVRILEKIGISERKPQAEAGMCELMNAANYV